MDTASTPSKMPIIPAPALDRNLTRADLDAMAAKVRNWGRWGPDDEVGTLNFVGEEEIRNAAALVRKGHVISMGMDFNFQGPQKGWGNRFNPIHTMLQTGTDAVAGNQDWNGIRYADDMVTMPLQCGTQWDALGHVFFDEQMWNGYDARLVDSTGAKKNGIDKTKDRMIGRGVLLDVARFKGGYLDDGYGISSAELDACAAAQGVEIRRGDYVIVRTGHMERCVDQGDWGGYAGGAAPGLRFETAEWVHRKEIAAICLDTWGCEVRPNESADPSEINQPWHWIVIPMIGISMGEIFNLRELSADCASDGIYEFMFCAPALPITGAVGSPINPLAIK